jgi:hypothetical protein
MIASRSVEQACCFRLRVVVAPASFPWMLHFTTKDAVARIVARATALGDMTLAA